MNHTPPDIRPPVAITLASGELHVWIVDLDSREKADGGTQQNPLSTDELQRAASFTNRRDGERWARSRALLRLLLGRYLSTDPAELRFELGKHGKPRLAYVPMSAGWATSSQAKLHFNLSHSQDIGLYVFALDSEVGCDVETFGRDINVLAVARRALGQEVAERLLLLDGEQREREFLRAWVRHEAALKCSGVGLASAESTASAPHTCISELKLHGAVGAVAATMRPTNISCRRWTETESNES